MKEHMHTNVGGQVRIFNIIQFQEPSLGDLNGTRLALGQAVILRSEPTPDLG